MICLAAFLAQLCLSGEQAAALPQWLFRAIEAEKMSAHPGSFEEVTYEGMRVFQFTRGDRVDTGDEHILFSEEGKEICKFGGFAGHVTSGVCDIHKIVYVRTL
jgi:hypothetical protein